MTLKPQTKIGILGGGQLARMLILRGHQMGLEMSVLCPSSDEPAAQVCSNWTKGRPHNIKTVQRFLKNIDFLTFESEFVDDKVIHLLKNSPKVFPSAQNMDLFQDRWTQKTCLLENKLPTSNFKLASDALPSLKNDFPKGCVFKARRNGYDGKGTWVFKKSLFDNVPSAIKKKSDTFIVEDFIPFKRELALTFICSNLGKIIALPMVETQQYEHRCLWVKGPIKHQGQAYLERKIKKFLKKINYVGAITFELFDTSHGLLINEVAPRVHNSAHYSWDALSEDQFTLHLKAIIGQNLMTPSPLARGFAMYNLIGTHTRSPLWSLSSDVSFHWYGKKDNRPGRKMGHLNARSSSASQALEKLKKAQKGFQL